ncbi:hypothetical protein BCEP4_1130032 [Burkholderia cepacia]|nr:hypothetical protein BCEP4_1130032 [Burkholderia cepacia]
MGSSSDGRWIRRGAAARTGGRRAAGQGQGFVQARRAGVRSGLRDRSGDCVAWCLLRRALASFGRRLG